MASSAGGDVPSRKRPRSEAPAALPWPSGADAVDESAEQQQDALSASLDKALDDAFHGGRESLDQKLGSLDAIGEDEEEDEEEEEGPSKAAAALMSFSVHVEPASSTASAVITNDDAAVAEAEAAVSAAETAVTQVTVHSSPKHKCLQSNQTMPST